MLPGTNGAGRSTARSGEGGLRYFDPLSPADPIVNQVVNLRLPLLQRSLSEPVHYRRCVKCREPEIFGLKERGFQRGFFWRRGLCNNRT